MDRPRLHRNVVALGLVSLLTDLSSEMIYPLLPVFLTATLAAGPAALGLIEGVAETTASLLKLFSGAWSDRTGRKKPLVLAGYGLSTLARPLVGFASGWGHVLAVRFSDRIGKGVRTSPRDALVAAYVPAAQRGKAFGLQRSMDHLGAVLGPVAAQDAPRVGRRPRGGGVADQEREDRDGGEAGHDRQEEDRAEGDTARQEEKRRNGPEHRPEVVHRPLKSERLSPLFRGDVCGDQCVSRGGPHSFPDPVEEPHGEDVSPSAREPHERPGKGGEAVPGEDQRLLPSAPVGPDAGEELEQARRRLRHPLDQPEDGGSCGQGGGEEDREERVDHLARKIG